MQVQLKPPSCLQLPCWMKPAIVFCHCLALFTTQRDVFCLPAFVGDALSKMGLYGKSLHSAITGAHPLVDAKLPAASKMLTPELAAKILGAKTPHGFPKGTYHPDVGPQPGGKARGSSGIPSSIGSSLISQLKVPYEKMVSILKQLFSELYERLQRIKDRYQELEKFANKNKPPTLSTGLPVTKDTQKSQGPLDQPVTLRPNSKEKTTEPDGKDIKDDLETKPLKVPPSMQIPPPLNLKPKNLWVKNPIFSNPFSKVNAVNRFEKIFSEAQSTREQVSLLRESFQYLCDPFRRISDNEVIAWQGTYSRIMDSTSDQLKAPWLEAEMQWGLSDTAQFLEQKSLLNEISSASVRTIERLCERLERRISYQVNPFSETKIEASHTPWVTEMVLPRQKLDLSKANVGRFNAWFETEAPIPKHFEELKALSTPKGFRSKVELLSELALKENLKTTARQKTAIIVLLCYMAHAKEGAGLAFELETSEILFMRQVFEGLLRKPEEAIQLSKLYKPHAQRISQELRDWESP
ncbi:hypothetical protein O181_056925 [Austropuccinia psidii MF-1]|uniref:Uncharacterized protein n=1 Tax=Austropuccinia psidii MF-1 TaxID=1389203 RepID=A0A9Q3HWI9_9BASI|nr:hypothetical protein [Austropuccinia psidii MF-1]